MENFEVDLDTECIWFADAWHTRDELAQEIREKLEAGDYHIAQPSQAIELLTQAVSQMKILSVRVPPEMAEALEAAGQETGRTVNAVIRQLVDAWLSQDFDDEEAMEDEAADDAVEEAAAEGDASQDEAEASSEEGDEEDAGELAEEAANALESEPTPAAPAEAAEESWFSAAASGGSKKKKK